MKQIGRKIYYEMATGNVLVDTGERVGSVVETTLEQDFEAYRALKDRVPETVGCLQLDFGQDADKFSQYLYRIDPKTKAILWDLTPPAAPLEQVKKAKIDFLNTECFKAIHAGFLSTSTSHTFRFNEEDQANFNQQSTLFLLKPELTDTQWKTEDAGIVTLTKAQFIDVVFEAGQYKQQHIEKYWTLKGKVEAATTKEEVDQINW
ncbi:DUF4376 domain-containing protein [Brevibacillus formosus]|uniref:DUF4376 domain-containing protein n=1 Tax=Brevibacillus formosus TaxID=54913 RepID=A0A837KM32_9BACL|nr:DUF4376 domain-containing protein [Brevibacillus formosus]KLH98770.1 hypothetical protein AA984_09475 [Brevibacillus formosus]MED1958058.1 DUF4376 domain-containing protein [Brevibacillus formosus]PSJ89221.1 DUF4376 domain-containing protein [Brevibacillus formosus]GED59380.1 hypothetical protein BFO01nite_35120 [Brevibacillus formosus]